MVVYYVKDVKTKKRMEDRKNKIRDSESKAHSSLIDFRQRYFQLKNNLLTKGIKIKR